MFLKRLIEVQPSKELKRENQLNDYYKNFGSCGAYFIANDESKDVYNASSIIDKSIRKTNPDEYSQSKFINTTATALASKFNGSSFRPGSASRPGSAKSQNSRISSAKSTNRATRAKPAWDDRWSSK